MLRQLIVASDRVGQEFIMWYLKSAFDAYQKVQSSLQTRLSEMQSAALSPLQAVKNFLQSAGADKSDANEEVRVLRERIAQLEAKQKKRAKTTAGRKTRPRTKEAST